MIRQDRVSEPLDAWSGMPVELEDVAFPSLSLPAHEQTSHRESRFAIKEFFWKYIASGSSGTPALILAVLALDESGQIRKRCADNSAADADTLSLLSGDRSDSVRQAVARNKNTPMYILKKLAHDQSMAVRYAIAANRQMPDAILLSLYLDPDPFVADRASQTLAA